MDAETRQSGFVEQRLSIGAEWVFSWGFGPGSSSRSICWRYRTRGRILVGLHLRRSLLGTRHPLTAKPPYLLAKLGKLHFEFEACPDLGFENLAQLLQVLRGDRIPGRVQRCIQRRGWEEDRAQLVRKKPDPRCAQEGTRAARRKNPSKPFSGPDERAPSLSCAIQDASWLSPIP